jgi:hypothetical protein
LFSTVRCPPVTLAVPATLVVVLHMAEDLKDLLRKEGIDPKGVLVLRHAPTKCPKLRAALPSLAKDRPDVFNFYQSTQWPKMEAAMAKAEYVASFIGHEPGKAIFVGLYDNLGDEEVACADLRKTQAYKELAEIGPGSVASLTRETCILFRLERMEVLSGLRGRLIIHWPPKERNWHRWADKNHFTVDKIA